MRGFKPGTLAFSYASSSALLVCGGGGELWLGGPDCECVFETVCTSMPFVWACACERVGKRGGRGIEEQVKGGEEKRKGRHGERERRGSEG